MNGGYVGLVGILIGIYLLNTHGPKFNKERSIEALFLLFTAAAPMILFELSSVAFDLNSTPSAHAPSASTADASTSPLPLRALGYRTLGAAATVLLAAFVYWTLDEYHSSFLAGVFDLDDRPAEVQCGASCRPKYYNFFRCLGLAVEAVGWHGLSSLALVYIGLTTHILSKHGGGDGLYYTGEACWMLLCRPFGADTGATAAVAPALAARPIVQHFLELLVRGFFSPLMFIALCDNLPLLHYKGVPTYMTGFFYFQNLVFTVDLSFAAIGYSLPGNRLLGNDFKSVEGTVLGFVCAMVCYYPFFDTLCDRYFDYAKNPPWHVWFDRLNGDKDASGWLVFQAWGVVLSLLQMSYALCSVHYGLGYSNLSYRKILKTGPYAVTRHPQYWTKLLSFAMISVPWVNLRPEGGAGRAVRNVLSLLGLSCVYVLRAWTEERHLAAAGANYPYDTLFSWLSRGYVV